VRLPVEDKYRAVKTAVHPRVTPRRAWAEYVKPALGDRLAEQRDAVRWEIRVLEVRGFPAKRLIELTYQQGIPWVVDHVPEGEQWISLRSAVSPRRRSVPRWSLVRRIDHEHPL
jgi:hypothetical protein